MGSQTLATHRPRGSTSAFAIIPMEPILPPEDLDLSVNHTYPPLPDASDAEMIRRFGEFSDERLIGTF
jgi:hypothetical protein